MIISPDTEKAFDKFPTPHQDTLRKLRIDGRFFNLAKNIYRKTNKPANPQKKTQVITQIIPNDQKLDTLP